MTRDDLLARYAEARKDSERAELEAAVWGTVPTADRRAGIGEWFSENVPAAARNEVSHRFTLWKAGAAGTVFLEACDGGLSLYAAVNLLRRAKAKVIPGGESSDPAEVARRVLAEYGASGRTMVVGDRMFVKRPQMPKGQARDKKPSVRPPKPPEYPGPKSFWKEVRSLCDAFVRERAPGLSPEDAEAVRREFEVDLQLVLNDLQRRVARAQSSAEARLLDASRASKIEVSEACATLGVDPPAGDQPVDAVTARRNYRKLARLYHPDMNGGDASQLPNYHSVIAAYKVVGDWNSRKA